MFGPQRREGRSAFSRHGGPQESQHDDTSDGYSSEDSASNRNAMHQAYSARTGREMGGFGFGRRAMGGGRRGGIRASLRALSRTILGSRPTGSRDRASSFSEDGNGDFDYDSDASSIVTGEDDSDCGDELAGRAPSLATQLGFHRRRRASRDDHASLAPSLAENLGFRRRRRNASSFDGSTPQQSEAVLFDYDDCQDDGFFSEDETTPDRSGSEDSSSKEEEVVYVYDDRQDTGVSNDQSTHDQLGGEDLYTIEEEESHHSGYGARGDDARGQDRDPYIPTPEDYPSRSRRDHSNYESYDHSVDYDAEGVSSGFSEDFLYPSRRRRRRRQSV